MNPANLEMREIREPDELCILDPPFGRSTMERIHRGRRAIALPRDAFSETVFGVRVIVPENRIKSGFRSSAWIASEIPNSAIAAHDATHRRSRSRRPRARSPIAMRCIVDHDGRERAASAGPMTTLRTEA
jgi:hypothetical protein